MLLAVYQREGKPQEALQLLEKLSAKYQRNYLVRLEMASTLNGLGRASDSCAIFESLLQDKSANAEDLIRYQYGEALVVNREYQRAAEQFIAVTKAAGADPDLVTWAFLRAGQALDLSGYRNEAIEQYRQVLARPNIYDSREQASRGLKKPFSEKEDQDESGIHWSDALTDRRGMSAPPSAVKLSASATRISLFAARACSVAQRTA
jgi:tetratricopeptide (TPR) repeat protein